MARLYHFSSPVVDRHSWNQISAVAMADHIYADPRHFLYPAVNMYDAADSLGLAQEIPLAQAITAALYHLFGQKPHVGRILPILMGMAGIVYFAGLVKDEYGETAALASSFFYSFSPLMIFFDRAIMPDGPMTASMIAGLYYFNRWSRGRKAGDLAYSCAATALAGTFKPFGLLIGLTYLLMIIGRGQLAVFKRPSIYLFGILSWLPAAAWLVHVFNLAGTYDAGAANEAANALSYGVLDVDLMLSGKYLSTIVSRFTDSFLTPWIFIYLVIGLFSWKKTRSPLFIHWIIPGILFYLVYTHKSFVHIYYQMPIIAPMALAAGIGLQACLMPADADGAKRKLRGAFIAITFMAFVAHSAKYAHNHYKLSMDSYHAGVMVRDLDGVSRDKDKLLVIDAGEGKYNQLGYYSGLYAYYLGDRCLPPEAIEGYLARGATLLAVNIPRAAADADGNRCLGELDNRFIPIAKSNDRHDKRGNPSRIAVYALAPRR